MKISARFKGREKLPEKSIIDGRYLKTTTDFRILLPEILTRDSFEVKQFFASILTSFMNFVVFVFKENRKLDCFAPCRFDFHRQTFMCDFLRFYSF